MSSARAGAIAGGASGLCQVVAEHPFDTVKVRLQTALPIHASSRHAGDVLRATLRREGAAALLQGLSPRLATYSLVKASLFSLYEGLKATCGSPAAAGFAAGALNTVVSCPQDVIKSQLQVQVRRPALRAHPTAQAWAAARLLAAIWKSRGLGGLYTGLPLLCARDAVGYSLLYSTFEYGRAHTPLPTPVVGGLAGVAFYVSTLPVDRLKTVLMTQDLLGGRPLPSVREALALATAGSGVRGLYRGIVPTVLRTFVGQGVALTVYSYASAALGQ